MATFSIGGAVGSGFRLIREHPAAVLVWGLTCFLVVFLPTAAVVAGLIPDLVKMSEVAPELGAPDAAAMNTIMAMQAKMLLLQAVQFVSAIVAAGVVYCAIFRAVLEPQDSRFWYMRLGVQEAWVALVYAVAMVLAMIAAFVCMIPLSIVGLVIGLGTKGSDPVSWLILAVLGLCIVAGFIWAIIRLALALPMSFADRTFRLFESWGLTKGHAGAMALTFLSVFVLVVLLEIAAVLLFVMVGGAAVAMSGMVIPWSQGPGVPITPPTGGWGGFLLVVVPLFGLLYSVLIGVLHAIWVTPIAYIYRELTAAPASTAPGA